MLQLGLLHHPEVQMEAAPKPLRLAGIKENVTSCFFSHPFSPVSHLRLFNLIHRLACVVQFDTGRIQSVDTWCYF